MARISQESQATLRVNPRVERFTVHEAPLERRLDKRQQLLDATTVVPLVSPYPSDDGHDHSRWLKVREIGTHLVSATLLCPRFDRSVVRVEQYQIELFLCALRNIRSILSDFSFRASGKVPLGV